jgi:hypothetical protein
LESLKTQKRMGLGVVEGLGNMLLVRMKRLDF